MTLGDRGAGRAGADLKTVRHIEGSVANAGDLLEPPAFFTRAMPSMDALLDGCDLCRQWLVASENIETEPRNFWKPIVLRVLGKDFEQLSRSITPFRRDQAELGHMPSNGVRQHRSRWLKSLCALVCKCCG
jgi:hypothetical protein